MKNWAGNLDFHPASVLAPSRTEEAQSIVREHLAQKKSIRMRGSGHSWTGLIATQESFLHLDNMQGVLTVDAQKKIVTAYAGTKLYRLGEEAFRHRLALPNQGDINKQSLAGALSTGTHGTGITLQSLANQIEAVKLITGNGDVLDLKKDADPELLKALAVSFGSLGLMTELSVKMIDAYKLKVESFPEDMDSSLAHLSQRLKNNRHLEMFYFPVGDWSLVKLMNQTQDQETKKGYWDKFNQVIIEDWLYGKLNQFAVATKSYRSIDALMRKVVGHQVFIDWSHQAFPTERNVRFMEMEYNLPVHKFEEVFSEIKLAIKKNHFQTLFPIEIRFVKGDDLWLSPASGRDSVYFAVHTYITEDWRPYFKEMETIFKRHGGRPHWGKWHSLKDQDFAQIYPKWSEFKKLRHELDPNGTWLNTHLKDIFAL